MVEKVRGRSIQRSLSCEDRFASDLQGLPSPWKKGRGSYTWFQPYPGNRRVQLYPGSFCHFMVEVTLLSWEGCHAPSVEESSDDCKLKNLH